MQALLIEIVCSSCLNLHAKLATTRPKSFSASLNEMPLLQSTLLFTLSDKWVGEFPPPNACGFTQNITQPVVAWRDRAPADLPIHTACSRHRTEVVSLLVKSDASRRTLCARATNRSLPLHLAVRYQAPVCVVETLLVGDEGRPALLERDTHGQLPLHVACRNGTRPDVIDMLLGRDGGMSTVMQENRAG